jgi:hypothetical protein
MFTGGTANRPSLSENSFPRDRRKYGAALYKIDRDNPNAARVRDLKFDSVRKHCLSLAPPKERQVMQGDAKDTPAPHYLTFVNNFSKWHRQVQIGQAFVVFAGVSALGVILGALYCASEGDEQADGLHVRQCNRLGRFLSPRPTARKYFRRAQRA